MLNEHRLIDDCLLNRWLIIALSNRYIVKTSASLDVQKWVFYCARRRHDWGGGGIYCASGLTMALVLTLAHSLTLCNYANCWRLRTTARHLGTLCRLI